MEEVSEDKPGHLVSLRWVRCSWLAEGAEGGEEDKTSIQPEWLCGERKTNVEAVEDHRGSLESRP